MPNDTPKNLRQLLSLVNSDKILSQDDVEQLVSAVVGILKEYKGSTDTLNKQLRDEVNEAINLITTQHKQVLSQIREEAKLSKSDIERATREQNGRAFARLQELIDNMNTFRDGVDGKDGKDADPEEVAELVMNKIKLPEYKEYILTPDDVDNQLKELKVYEQIDDLDKKFENRFADALNRIRLTRGVKDITASSSNITVTKDGDGNVIISNPEPVSIEFVMDGGGSAISTGIKGDLVIDFDGEIQSWTLLADQTGSMVMDVWKDSFINFPPLVGDSITGSEQPTLSSESSATSDTLTGWTTTINAGDVLRFNVDSASTVTRATLSLKVIKQ